MDVQEILAVIGDLELTRRQLVHENLELKARVADLETTVIASATETREDN